MALGEYRPPNQINSDEDKYGKGRLSFTKTQLGYAFVGLLMGGGIFAVLNATGIMLFQVIGVLSIILGLVGGVALGGMTRPNSKYLRGGGLRIDMYLKQKLKKKFSKKKRVLYCKNIDRNNITVTYRSKHNYAKDGDAGLKGLLEDFKSMFGG